MKTLQQQTLANGEDGLMSLQEVSLASLSARPEKGEEQKMTVSSGRTCCEQLRTSGQLGSLLKMLGESEHLYSKAAVLRWRLEPTYSERRVIERTMCDTDSSLKTSAEKLSVQDIPSNRCLFRLVVLARPTEGIESSLSPTEMLLQTPTVVMTEETPEVMRARAERNGYKNGTLYASLASQVKFDPKVQLLKTPTAMEYKTEQMKSWQTSRDRGSLSQQARSGQLDFLLPTPTCSQISHPDRVAALKEKGVTDFYSRENGERRPNGLIDFLAFNNMLLTPSASDGMRSNVSMESLRNHRKPNAEKSNLAEQLAHLEGGGATCEEETDGDDSRLNPLFVEEMMGFPSLWTTLPFLT